MKDGIHCHQFKPAVPVFELPPHRIQSIGFATWNFFLPISSMVAWSFF
jgi:hypothetical protein